ncbi:MAG: AAA family ATPase [Actinobacteria bacterium]|nr:AAA family ATPase [Actinomycetota bacterium]
MNVYVTVGLPASGKSTWACQVAEQTGAMRWNNDEFSYMASGIPGPGSFGRVSVNFLQEMMSSFIREATAAGRDVIVDNTNLHPMSIPRIESSIAVDKYELRVVTFEVPVAECVRRDAARTPGVGKEVILSMYHKYREHHPWMECEEGFDIETGLCEE